MRDLLKTRRLREELAAIIPVSLIAHVAEPHHLDEVDGQPNLGFAARERPQVEQQEATEGRA